MMAMFPCITSSSNPKIKDIARLREGKYRRRTGCFLIEGVRELQRAILGNVEIIEVYGLEDRCGLLRELALSDKSPNKRCSFHLVSETVFEKISYGNRREGVLAVARTPDRSLEHFDAWISHTANPIIAVLEGVEKPGNVGAVFRSADGAGLDGVIVADKLSDLFNPNTIRSSLGTVFQFPAAESDTSGALDWLRSRKIAVAVARCDGAIPYTEYDFRGPTAIVVGNEAEGLTESWKGQDVTSISLPMLGIADSLNVSVAAAVLFYEAQRQRSLRG